MTTQDDTFRGVRVEAVGTTNDIVDEIGLDVQGRKILMVKSRSTGLFYQDGTGFADSKIADLIRENNGGVGEQQPQG